MDERIVAALAEPEPPEGASAAAVAMYAKMTNKLAEYDECVAGSRSAEGLSLSMSIDAAAKQVGEYHAAYRRLLSPAKAGTNPDLLRRPAGWCVDWSNGQLHRL